MVSTHQSQFCPEVFFQTLENLNFPVKDYRGCKGRTLGPIQGENLPIGASESWTEKNYTLSVRMSETEKTAYETCLSQS